MWWIIGILAVIAFSFWFASRAGRFIARNEQRAYVMHVLHAVETRGMADAAEREWTA